MKKIRKGFTLVELLIVIAILGALSASMAVSAGNATARAKAQSIVNNIEACKAAAALYYSEAYNSTEDLSQSTSANFLKDDSEYVPGWKDFTTGSIKYSVDAQGKGHVNWAIQIDFTGDADKTSIATVLAATRGFNASTAATTAITAGKFNVNLVSGKIGICRVEQLMTKLSTYNQPTH